MSYQNLYEVGLEINGVSGDINPHELSFSIKDSIYDLYPTGELQLNDPEGWLLEGRGFTIGSQISLSFTYNGEELNQHFIVSSMETSQAFKTTQLSGIVKANLIHKAKREDIKESSAHDARPSSIVQELFSYPFEDEEIESTLKIQEKKMYRPWMTKEKFINTILLPNSLSQDNKRSPFFCFIDTQNILNYKSFIAMMKQSPLFDISYGYQNSYDHYNQAVLNLFPFTEKLTQLENSIKIDIGYIHDETLELVQEQKEISSLFFGSYPIYNILKRTDKMFFDVKRERKKEQIDSYIINSQRYALLPDKLLVTTPFYSEYRAGQVLSVEALYGNTRKSNSYSGDYLIERTNHIWNGETSEGFTQMVLGTPNPNFSTNSALEGRLIDD